MSNYWVYQDESGEPGKDDYFIVGILCMTEGQRDKVLQSIRNIREVESFNNEFHFQKFSNKRADIYSKVIKCILRDHYVSFRSIVVKRDLVRLDMFGNKRHFIYNKFTQLLIEHTIKFRSENIHIRPDHKNRLKIDNFYSYLLETCNYNAWMKGYRYTVKSCKSSDSKKCDLNQICDLLTGIVRNKYIPAGERKNEFSGNMLMEYGNKIKIWEWSPKKSP